MEHDVQDDEDEDESDGQHQHEAVGTALLAFVLSGPVDLVSRGQFDLIVDLADGLFDGRAEVAVAHTVLDGDVALAGFAVDLLGAVLGLDVGDWARETRSPLGARRRMLLMASWVLRNCGSSERLRRSELRP